jgi:hypothetical protein
MRRAAQLAHRPDLLLQLKTYRREPARRRAPTLRHETVEPAHPTTRSNRALLDDAAVQESFELAHDERRHGALGFGGGSEEAGQMLLDCLMQEQLLRMALR